MTDNPKPNFIKRLIIKYKEHMAEQKAKAIENNFYYVYKKVQKKYYINLLFDYKKDLFSYVYKSTDLEKALNEVIFIPEYRTKYIETNILKGQPVYGIYCIDNTENSLLQIKPSQLTFEEHTYLVNDKKLNVLLLYFAKFYSEISDTNMSYFSFYENLISAIPNIALWYTKEVLKGNPFKLFENRLYRCFSDNNSIEQAKELFEKYSNILSNPVENADLNDIAEKYKDYKKEEKNNFIFNKNIDNMVKDGRIFTGNTTLPYDFPDKIRIDRVFKKSAAELNYTDLLYLADSDNIYTEILYVFRYPPYLDYALNIERLENVIASFPSLAVNYARYVIHKPFYKYEKKLADAFIKNNSNLELEKLRELFQEYCSKVAKSELDAFKEEINKINDTDKLTGFFKLMGNALDPKIVIMVENRILELKNKK